MNVLASVVDSFDQTWAQLEGRLDGLGQAEYLWEPAPHCWTVRDLGDGEVRADWADPDPDPAPVTTIAWRMWHVAVDALEGYSMRAFGISGTGLTGRDWVLEPDVATEVLAYAVDTFREGVLELGDAGLARPLGPEWGDYADHTHLHLLLHAHREMTHHGAEIALLRDLYRARDEAAIG